MNPTETLSAPSSFTGYVRNGVVILDAQITLSEGQAVRIEPLYDTTGRVLQLQQLFNQWTEEDAKLPLEEADRLHIALEQNQGLQFRLPELI